MLANNAEMVFYDGIGRVRAVASIRNVTSIPSKENYYTPPQCGDPCYLDDPYEGELMIFFMDLLGKWENEKERDLMWEFKRGKLQSVTYNSRNGPITVQRGWWFSAHEQWKYLVLPYQEIDIARRVFLNGERARTHNSEANGIPGLYASVTDVTNGTTPTDYISAAGIPEICFEPVTRTDVITPYAAFPLMLANISYGLAWYHWMISGSKMQGPHGSSEATLTNGTKISPIMTWDSKITSVVAILGGIVDITAAGMREDGVKERFDTILQREYSMAFPVLQGESISFALPTTPIPKLLQDFSTCSTM